MAAAGLARLPPAVGVVLVVYGVTMFYFRLPYIDVYILSDEWIPLITVLWLLGMTNAINLIDGLDGLAAGIVAIGAGAFFLYSTHLGDPKIGMLTQPNLGPFVSIIAVGICVGFLPHNFNPARIFMGDGGALLLGLLMAVSTSVVGGRADPTSQRFVGQTYFFLAPLFIASAGTSATISVGLTSRRMESATRADFPAAAAMTGGATVSPRATGAGIAGATGTAGIGRSGGRGPRPIGRNPAHAATATAKLSDVIHFKRASIMAS